MRSEEEDEFLDNLQESEELEDRELINIVRMNSFLYNKSEKLYSNNEMKRLAWTTIGNSLSKKKTGAETERRFLQLRQRFGKERRKVIQSQCRSGAGANHLTYTPRWDLYNDLMFLTDVIKHRNTASNYKKKLPVHEVVSCNDTEMSCPSTSASNSSCTQSFWNENLAVISSECDVSDNSNVNETSVFSQQPLSQLANTTLFLEDSNKNTPSAKQMQEVMAGTYKKRIPEPDSFTQSKKRDINTFNKSILDQSKSLNILAQKVGDALSARTSEPAPVTSHVTELLTFFSLDVRAMLSSIGFALQKVPESKQLDCLIAIMQLVKRYIE